jgi:hypothetical protein
VILRLRSGKSKYIIGFAGNGGAHHPKSGQATDMLLESR